MQSCEKCKASWDIANELTVCPFCGTDLNKPKEISSIEDALALIVERHGEAVFNEGNRLLGLLSDYASSLVRERKLVKIAIESGAYKAIYQAPQNERKNTLNKYVSILEESFFIDKTWATTALMWCLDIVSPDSRTIKESTSQIQGVVKQENGTPTQVNKQPETVAATSKSTITSSIWMDIRNGILKKYTGNDWLVTIPEGVTEIAERAFYDNKTVEVIRLPATVKHIRKSAFSYCAKLREVTLNNGVETIEDWAFLGCSSLESMVVPPSVKQIGELVFQGCERLEKIILSDEIVVIPERAFAECKNLRSVTLPQKLKYVRKEAFDSCSEIQSLTFPASLLSIDEEALDGCYSLNNIFVPSKANVHVHAFGRFNLDSNPEIIILDNPQSVVSVPIGVHIQNNTLTVSSMDYVPDSRWRRDKSWESVTKVILGPGITEIKMEAFRGLKDLREVVLPEGLKKIGFSAFADCIKLDNVVIPEGTTTIAAHAFEKCNKLANITIPRSVKYIGDAAFTSTAIKSTTVQKDCVICPGNYPITASVE